MGKSGILLHISSLPSPYGIGTLGKSAYVFADFLHRSAQTFWQVLPLGPTGYGDSPYSSASAFACNPYLIDLDTLCCEGLLRQGDYEYIDWGEKKDSADYGRLYENREKVLFKAYKNFDINQPEFKEFCAENAFWLDGYSLFMAIKRLHGNKSWEFWQEKYRIRDKAALSAAAFEYNDYTGYIKFTQYAFIRQWKKLKAYANAKGIKIIGDMPIYSAYDSSDVWGAPEMYLLDKNLLPVTVAGVPPDNFTPDGQLWGNPIYNWQFLKDTGYSWWIKRLEKAFQLYDMVRIDHFRGFESYFAVNYGDKNARRGIWHKGPGASLFIEIEKRLGKLDIIAEDLGYLNEDVRNMLKSCGFPGMKVLQFGFDTDESNEYLPHNYTQNCVAYTGTHDNNTTAAWYKALKADEKKFFKKYLNLRFWQNPVDKLIRAAFASRAKYVVIPMQDWLKLSGRARMNYPSTLFINWKWRLKRRQLNKRLSEKIKKITTVYGRERDDRLQE